MLNTFLVYNAVIARKNITTVKGETKAVESVVYSAVPSYYYRDTGNLKSSNLSSNTPSKKYKVIINPSFPVEEGMIVIIDNKRLLIDDVKKNFMIGKSSKVYNLWNDDLTWNDGEIWQDFVNSNLDSYELLTTEI